MTFLNANAHRVNIPCQACTKKFSVTIGQLRTKPQLTCTCGATTTVNLSKFDQGMAGAEKAIKDFQDSLRKLGK
jgi:hypothetical protein